MKKKAKQILTAIIGALVFIGVVVLSSRLAYQAEVLAVVDSFGYFGIFLVSFISGFNVVVPIPVIGFWQLFVEAGLAVWGVIAVITFGMTLGDMVGFMIGKTGRSIESKAVHAHVARIDTVTRKYRVGPMVLLFLYACFAPAPNELIVMPLAFMGYRLKIMFPILLLGNAVFNTLVVLGIGFVLG